MWSRRWFSAAVFVAIALSVGLSRWSNFVTPRPPQPVAPRTRRSTAAADSRRVAIPRLERDAIAAADERSRRGATNGSSARRADVADHVLPGTPPQPLAPAAPIDRPSADIGSSAPEAPNVSELMVCHVDSRGPYGAADALQECIARAPAYSSIEIPPGVYVLYRQVVVATPLTIRTAGSGGTSLSCVTDSTQCAVFVAAPDLVAMWGPLVVWSTNNVTLEHLVIDGNRAARAAATAAGFCLTRSNTFGFNASVLDCRDCALDDVVSTHALCGTGMVWSGAHATIQRSAFVSNGDATHGMWSDGLTLIYAPGSVVRENRFVDNSDVALLIAYGVQSRVEDNVVVQRAQPSFAGLMLHNFNSTDLSTSGDFRGASVAHNLIDCGAQLCVFGIQVGPRPWNAKLTVIGGDVHDNEVRGAKVGINVDGAGVQRAPVAIHDNIISNVPQGAHFSDCARPIAAYSMNISPTSVVDRGDDDTPTGAHLSDMCQLSSNLTAEDQ